MITIPIPIHIQTHIHTDARHKKKQWDKTKSTSAAFYGNITQILFTCFVSLGFMYILERLMLPEKYFLNKYVILCCRTDC